MEKTRDLFEKTGEIKGTFHARLGTIKDRNSSRGPNRSRRDKEEPARIHRRIIPKMS